MIVEGVVLKVVKKGAESIVLLDFPNDIPLRVTDILNSQISNVFWKIRGVGLPILKSSLKEKMNFSYNSDFIYDCLLECSEPNFELKTGDKLLYEF